MGIITECYEEVKRRFPWRWWLGIDLTTQRRRCMERKLCELGSSFCGQYEYD